MSGAETLGLRERTRRAVRRELADLALGMFVQRGYDATTVEDIAAAGGLSKRSFFRYFPAKEDVLLGDVEEFAEQIAGEIRSRPGGEDPWDTLRLVLREWEPRIHTARNRLDALRLVDTTPSLRARLHQKRDELRALISAALLVRPGTALDAFTADLLTAAACAAVDAATREWLRSDGTRDHAALIDQAFAALTPTEPAPHSPHPEPSLPNAEEAELSEAVEAELTAATVEAELPEAVVEAEPVADGPRRFRMDASLNDLPPLDASGFRNPVPADIPVLGDLMWHAYQGTPDEEDAGEDVGAAVEEIGLVYDGERGEFVPSASFVAVDDQGRPTAAALVTLWKGVPLLAYLFTSPEHTGRGLGRRLVAASMHALAAQGHQVLSLAVTEDNARAGRLYESLGFRFAG
ncbi:GNAT family N-acetyltransferase [Actinomadura rupiterrae]|uniref:GNAT family N-acetyltransferase n=1 Tax=Actinomadura rupiterrae TaxID=559627 RepID=UPI0020A5B355|nr:GNAT family N-acetyltransferase [Actinomadura rupiterrae]MCP2335401.1 AcrR family transcriptional regulator/GNAT superfamily N-acetyltransferase [Actinomadura rupiterrae]